MAQLGGGRGGVAAYAADVTVPASDEYTTAGAQWSVMVASQASIQCKVVSTDAGDSDVVAFHFIGRGQDTVNYPTVASFVVNVTTSGNATARQEAVVNVMPYAYLKVLKIVNGNGNDVTANAEVAYTN